ncbi:MAG TPA: hypothetical protein VLD85_03545 [Anaeromyxobacteraceae bacterium]|nr:hypothetical protein [Anaeromyxobacteraceae bacterium]
MRRARAAAAAALLLLGTAARSEGSWSFQVLLGGPLNLPMPLTIRQAGQPDIRLTAHYSSRPFQLPLHWGIQVARQSGGADWALELVHQKLYLDNPPPEVQYFSITHGFNLLTLSRGFRLGDGLWTRVGAGAVLAHPESMVRGLEFSGGGLLGSGQYLCGATLVATLEKRIALADRLYLALDGKVAASYARVPVAGGDASVPSVSFHLLSGLGYGPAD